MKKFKVGEKVKFLEDKLWYSTLPTEEVDGVVIRTKGTRVIVKLTDGRTFNLSAHKTDRLIKLSKLEQVL